MTEEPLPRADQPPGEPAAHTALSMRVSERKLLLALVDLVVVNGALLLALALRTSYSLDAEFLLAFTKWFVTLSLVWLAVGLVFDVYNLPRASSAGHSLRGVAGAALVTALVYLLIPRLTPPLETRSMPMLFALFACLGVMSWRLVYALVLGQPWFIQCALIVGADEPGRELAVALRSKEETPNPFRGTGYRIAGFIDETPGRAGRTVYGIPVLGGHDQLLPAVRRHDVDEVVLAVPGGAGLSDELLEALLQASEQGCHITTMSQLYERLLGRIPVLSIGRDLPSVLSIRESASERFMLLGKRAADLLFGLIGALTTLLIIPFLWLANRFLSPGPLFYRQLRVGQGGRLFDLVKFRSMVPDAEAESGAVWASENDERVTALGRLLRRTRLDELPQSFNILRGEMSLVGPRPERPEFVEQLVHLVPFYRARHAVKPGLTGWAQVHYEYGNSVDDARIKLEYDLFYIKNRSLLLDLQIWLKTAAVVLRMQGM